MRSFLGAKRAYARPKVPPPMRQELDPGDLRFSLNGGWRLWTLRTEGTGGQGDGRGGDAFFRDDLEQHDKQWLLQPRGLRLGARAVLHRANLVSAQAAPGPGGSQGVPSRGGRLSLEPHPPR
ncbi:hypothetical protein P7K49_030467 [Saguinus oedipus]|uniref:Uncharacterized protein n=1 Tax=Saguinus oedipus TaxID=9490 RepID=A0ABQ9U297_SAGOE|nr:hypothetical protein P7K49_030467 [Saguinus oedipus]